VREVAVRKFEPEATMDDDEKYPEHSDDNSQSTAPKSPRAVTAASPSPVHSSASIVSTVHHPSAKVEHILSDRSRLVVFADGTRKHIAVDGSTRVDFPNGDYKIHSRHAPPRQPHTIYYYAGRRVLHRSYEAFGSTEEAVDEYVFEDGQVERHWKDGRKEIRFADGSRKSIDTRGRQTTMRAGEEEEKAEEVEEEFDGEVETKRWGVRRAGSVRGLTAAR